MRKELFFKPMVAWDRLLEAFEDLGQWAGRKRRQGRLRCSKAQIVSIGQLDCLELLEIMRLSSRPIIYDVGAHRGEWTVLAKAVYPEAIIHAFEPSAAHLASFSDTTTGLKDVTYHPLALGRECGRQDLHIPELDDAASLRRLSVTGEKYWSIAERRQEQVRVVGLDEYRVEQGLPTPDVIKLDIQGCELDALQGAEKCLASVRWIVSEVSFEEFYEGQPLCHDVVAWLGQRGWRVYSIGKSTDLGRPLIQADILFQNEAFLK